MLQHVPRAQPPAGHVADGPVQAQALAGAAVAAAVQDVVVVEDGVAGVEPHDEPARHARLERVRESLGVGARPRVRARDHDERLVAVAERQVPLRVPGRLPQARDLLLGGGGGRDVVAVPPQLVVAAVGRPHEQVVQLHDELVVAAVRTQELLGRAEDLVAEVAGGEGGRVRQRRVHQVLDAPDADAGAPGPRRELLADGAHVRPPARDRQFGCALGGAAELLYLRRAEDRPQDYEAVLV